MGSSPKHVLEKVLYEHISAIYDLLYNKMYNVVLQSKDQ